MSLRYSTIATRSVELTSPEAVAIALAAAHACAPGRALPAPEHIRLAGSGAVAITKAGKVSTDEDRLARLRTLLELLLGLDAPPRGRPRADVPGALMLLLARAAGAIDLPAPRYAEFHDALHRFGSPDPRTLAAVYRRMAAAASPRRHTVAAAAAAMLVAAAASAAFLTVAAGRRPGPPTSSSPVQRTARVEVTTPALPARPAPTAAPDVSVDAAAGPPSPADSGRHAGRSDLSATADAVRVRPLLSSAQLGADLFSPSFSDAREVLFHAGRGRGALMRASFDTEGRAEVQTVLRDASANYHAVRSPDGRLLAFDSDRDGTRGVYVAAVGDADRSRRISGDGYAAVPRWSPDGRSIAFIKADAGRPRVWNVWVADLASGARTQVSHHRVGQAWGASWFPDGQRLAYSVEDTLVISAVQTGKKRVLPSPRKGRLVRTPAVSPDGRWIVFQVYRDGVWLLEVATGRTRRVLGDPAAEEFAWAPEGGRIAYHTRRGSGWSLWQFSLPML